MLDDHLAGTEGSGMDSVGSQGTGMVCMDGTMGIGMDTLDGSKGADRGARDSSICAGADSTTTRLELA